MIGTREDKLAQELNDREFALLIQSEDPEGIATSTPRDDDFERARLQSLIESPHGHGTFAILPGQTEAKREQPQPLSSELVAMRLQQSELTSSEVNTFTRLAQPQRNDINLALVVGALNNELTYLIKKGNLFSSDELTKAKLTLESDSVIHSFTKLDHASVTLKKIKDIINSTEEGKLSGISNARVKTVASNKFTFALTDDQFIFLLKYKENFLQVPPVNRKLIADIQSVTRGDAKVTTASTSNQSQTAGSTAGLFSGTGFKIGHTTDKTDRNSHNHGMG